MDNLILVYILFRLTFEKYGHKCPWKICKDLQRRKKLQIIGVPDKAEKDQIVKSVMDLKNAEVEEGYTREAVASRRVGKRFVSVCHA